MINTDPNEFKRFHTLITKDHPGYEPFYIPLCIRGKDPLPDMSWEKSHASFEQAVKYLEMGHNIGIVATDKDQLVIMDKDDIEAVGITKPTLTVKSRKRYGEHGFYFSADKVCTDINEDSAKQNISTETSGEIRAVWEYVVCAGSYVPVDKDEVDDAGVKTWDKVPDNEKVNAGKYTIHEPNPVASITFKEIPEVYTRALIERRTAEKNPPPEPVIKKYLPTNGDKNKTQLFDLTIGDVTGKMDDGSHRFPSLFHESATGMNTSISQGVMTCWRHSVSHSPMTALAVAAGLGTCSSLGYRFHARGSSAIDLKDGETQFKLWKYAKKNRLISLDDPIPSKALVYFAISNKLCVDSDIVDGWKLPTPVYNEAIKKLHEAGIIPGRPPFKPKKEVTKTTILKEKDEPDEIYEKATCMGCKHFPTDGYCWTKRTGIKPDKVACNKYLPAGTPDREEVKEPESPKHIIEEANKVLKSGDPVAYVFNAHQKLHIGDEILTYTRIAAVGNQSATNTKGIQPSADGSSGKGKSDGDKKFVHLLPKEYVLSGSISDKVLYYKKDLKPGTYIYSDDVVLSEDLTSTIKRATSNFQGYTPHHTLDKDRNVLENSIPPRMVWGLNSVDNVNSLQLINRQFGCSVDETTEQDDRVLIYQKVCGMLGTEELPETDDVLVCREIIRDIKKHLFRVVIPFSYLIEWKDSGNRRNFDMFEDMIRGFCVFRYKQRQQEGDILIANLKDFDEAVKLYGNRTEQQGRQLTDPELKLITKLNELGSADSKTIQEKTGLSQGRISHLMRGKGKDSDSGLIHKVKELHCEKRIEATQNGGTATKTYYSIEGFDEAKYKGAIVWITEEARKEYEAYYQLITRLLLLKINNIKELITHITNITKLHSNEIYNKLLAAILNPDNKILLGYFANKGNKGNNLPPGSGSEEVISGNNLGNKPEVITPGSKDFLPELPENSHDSSMKALSKISGKTGKTGKTGNNEKNATEIVTPVEKGNTGTCGICNQPLNDELYEFTRNGLGNTHTKCKYEIIRVKAIVNMDYISPNTHTPMKMVKGECYDLPAIQAISDIRKGLVEQVTA